MSFYPHNPNLGQTQQTDAPGVHAPQAWVRHLRLTAAQAAAADTDAVHAAVTDDGEEQVITAGFTAPPYPRNITATAGGTATDIAAIQVIVEGTNAAGEAITETLPAFTENSAGTVVGNKAFATVTEWTIPAHDGTAATTSLGFGDKIGLPDRLAHSTLLASYRNNTIEGTPATVVVSTTELESNTVDLNSALNGTVVDLYYLI